MHKTVLPGYTSNRGQQAPVGLGTLAKRHVSPVTALIGHLEDDFLCCFLNLNAADEVTELVSFFLGEVPQDGSPVLGCWVGGAVTASIACRLAKGVDWCVFPGKDAVATHRRC